MKDARAGTLSPTLIALNTAELMTSHVSHVDYALIVIGTVCEGSRPGRIRLFCLTMVKMGPFYQHISVTDHRTVVCKHWEPSWITTQSPTRANLSPYQLGNDRSDVAMPNVRLHGLAPG